MPTLTCLPSLKSKSKSKLSPATQRRHCGVQPPLDNSFKKLTLEYCLEVMRPHFQGRTDVVDWVVFQEDPVTLCDETAAYLYQHHTPLTLKYKRGSRPTLEKIVQNLLKPGWTEREKAIAIMKFCRDIPDQKTRTTIRFHGGTEEEIIEKGSANCAEQGRVLCALMQIAGIPARFVLTIGCPDIHGKITNGHAMNEIFIEGRWAYIDIRGTHFEWPNGRLASAWDLMMFQELLNDQPQHVLKHLRKGYTIESFKLYFRGRRIMRISNYFVWDHHKYTYDHSCPGEKEMSRLNQVSERIIEKYKRKFLEQGLIPPPPPTLRSK